MVHVTAPEPQRCNLRFAREPLEIGKHGRDELLSARILRCQRGSKEMEKIASLLGGFAPICCRRGEQMGFQFILPTTECALSGLHCRRQPGKVWGFLGGNAAV